MRLIDQGKTTIALATAAALFTLAAPAAFAGHGNGHGNGNKHGHRRYARAYCERPVAYYSRPVVYAAPRCDEPRYVTYRPQHVVIVRPTPYIRVGTRIGPVDISAIFGPDRYASQYEYGCNFCDAHYGSFGGYENHVQHCGNRPSNVHLEVHAWGDNGYGDLAYDDYDGR